MSFPERGMPYPRRGEAPGQGPQTLWPPFNLPAPLWYPTKPHSMKDQLNLIQGNTPCSPFSPRSLRHQSLLRNSSTIYLRGPGPDSQYHTAPGMELT